MIFISTDATTDRWKQPFFAVRASGGCPSWLHIHWRYPSGSGIYSHTAATSRPLRVDSRHESKLFKEIWKLMIMVHFLQYFCLKCDFYALKNPEIRKNPENSHACDSEAIGAPLWCCLTWRHHRVTWIPLWCICHLPNSEIFIAPEYIFHSNCERHYKAAADDPDCQDWENICDSMCAARCRLLVIGVKYVLPFSTTSVSGLVYPAHWYGRWSSVHLTHVA